MQPGIVEEEQFNNSAEKGRRSGGGSLIVKNDRPVSEKNTPVVRSENQTMAQH